VAIYRNNLGGVWDLLGQSEKAIAYFELALTTFENVLGVDHAWTKKVAKKLAAVGQ
jgi:hypothetical protein